ncbi:MAG: hypothetical protein MI750_16610 [Xanthomonadales bacterium]|nr:hypothetical protein [Xanthomonadales bacterium]
MSNVQSKTIFNSSLETGVRTLIVLVASHPVSLDLKRLIDFDYLVVHSGDVEGPESLHPPIPMREGEMLVRRNVVESGLMLMMSRGLVERVVTDHGMKYRASDTAMPFINCLTVPYILELRDRADWVIGMFGQCSEAEVNGIISRFFDKWASEFQSQ